MRPDMLVDDGRGGEVVIRLEVTADGERGCRDDFGDRRKEQNSLQNRGMIGGKRITPAILDKLARIVEADQERECDHQRKRDVKRSAQRIDTRQMEPRLGDEFDGTIHGRQVRAYSTLNCRANYPRGGPVWSAALR